MLNRRGRRRRLAMRPGCLPGCHRDRPIRRKASSIRSLSDCGIVLIGKDRTPTGCSAVVISTRGPNFARSLFSFLAETDLLHQSSFQPMDFAPVLMCDVTVPSTVRIEVELTPAIAEEPRCPTACHKLAMTLDGELALKCAKLAVW